MAVYVDALRKCLKNTAWTWDKACHMVADSDEELHDFAKRIGLRQNWHQVSDSGLSHYDLTPGRRKEALRAGAIEIDRERMVKDFIRPAREKLERGEHMIEPLEADFKYFCVRAGKNRDKAKRTFVYDIVDLRNGKLGVVKWFGPWRQYCFYPAADTVWNTDCMKDVQDFLSRLKQARSKSGVGA